ncbi:MAG: segregation/condensation protein A, partial [Elusimicrobia bacterium]|nr:segregation/condensation protein A [Elusimicrobiota bacterium]
IFDIPISQITQEYLRYLDAARQIKADIAGEFLIMAATLMQIKVKMLLPKISDNENGADPREELVSKLILAQRFAKLAQELSLKRQAMDQYAFRPAPVFESGELTLLNGFDDIFKSFERVMMEFEETHGHSLSITMDAHPVEAKMEKIERLLAGRATLALTEIWADETSRLGLVACFLAILELIKRSAIRVMQQGVFGEIHLVKALPV